MTNPMTTEKAERGHLAGDANGPTNQAQGVSSSEQPQLVWSLDGQNYAYSELCEALDMLEANGDLGVGAVLHVGEVKRYDPTKWCDADDVIEMLGDRAYEQGHEFAEDYPTPTKEAVAELDALLSAWINKHCTPDFYGIKNAKEYVVTEADVADYSNEGNAQVAAIDSPEGLTR